MTYRKGLVIMFLCGACACAHAMFPSFDIPGFGAQIISKMKKAQRDDELNTLLKKGLEQNLALGKSGIEATNNAYANATVRLNQARTDIHNLEVAGEAAPYSSIGDLASIALAREKALAQAWAHVMSRQGRILRGVFESREFLSRAPNHPRIDPNRVLALELAARLGEAFRTNRALEQEAGRPLAPEEAVAMPWDSWRFLNGGRILPMDEQAARDMVDILLPPYMTSAKQPRVKQAAETHVGQLRANALQNLVNADLHDIVDRRVAGPGGLPSLAESHTLVSDHFYRGENAFALRAAESSTPISEVQRGRALMAAQRLQQQLALFQRELKQEAMLSRRLALRVLSLD